MEKHSFKIPKGCKATVTQENGMLVVEIETEKVFKAKEEAIIICDKLNAVLNEK